MMPIVGFGGYVKATDLAAAIARAGADADCWREGWAFAYSGSRLYGDDGELQDNRAQPFIDWRRESAQEIRAKIQERGNRANAAKPDEGEGWPAVCNRSMRPKASTPQSVTVRMGETRKRVTRTGR